MKNKKVILIVLDGTGVGSMKDCAKTRPQDEGFNTIKTVVNNPDKLPNLKKLGLFAIANNKFENFFASNGKIELLHTGADTYFGHQEIMGSKPPKLILSTVAQSKEIISKVLKENNFNFEYCDGYFLVNEKVVIADNIEADLGLVVNVSASTFQIPFQNILEIGQIIRSVVDNSRVIALGGTGTDIDTILASIKKTVDGRTGVDTPKSNIYLENYKCIHIGYQIDVAKQLQTQFIKNNLPVSLIGKMQDIIQGDNIWRKPCVPTIDVLKTINERLDQQDGGLIAATIQETDLGGHNQDKNMFYKALKETDEGLSVLLKKITEQDLLIITADHGNDPNNGSSAHTREYAPLIVYQKGKKGKEIGIKKTLSDISASILTYFNLDNTSNGKNFLK